MQELPQLSAPVAVCPQVGAALQLPFDTHALQAAPVLVQELPQLSTPVAVCPQAGVALQLPFGVQPGVFCASEM